MSLTNSIFETRRAKVRYGNEVYSELQNNLRDFARTCENGLRKTFEDKFIPKSLLWDITETILHDMDSERVECDYPVLLVGVRLVRTEELWVEKTCPYTIVIPKYGISLYDKFSNTLEAHSETQAVVRTLT